MRARSSVWVRAPEAGASPDVDNPIMRIIIAAILLLLSSASRGLEAQDSTSVNERPDFRDLQSQAESAVDWKTWRDGLGAEVKIKVDNNDTKDSLRGVSVSMERETETDGHGFLGLKWRLREVANLELIHLGNGLYVVANVSGTVSSKAPFGNWHVKEERPPPEFYSGLGVGNLVANLSLSKQVTPETERD